MQVCNENGFVSAWSTMHFLSGYMWSLIWMAATSDFLPWLNLLLFAIAAIGFEILENLPRSGAWMWGFLGYDEKTYTGDSAINSVSDVLVSLVGWVVVRGVLMGAGTTGASVGALLGLAGALFLVFLYVYRIERRVQGIDASPVRPALILKA